MEIKVKGATTHDFAKRAFWLAWQACGGPMGMGFFQDRPNATEDEVYMNVVGAGDYPANLQGRKELYADYVFGRMMKWGLKLGEDSIVIVERPFKWDYQAFSRKYADNKALLDAVALSLRCTYEVVK